MWLSKEMCEKRFNEMSNCTGIGDGAETKCDIFAYTEYVQLHLNSITIFFYGFCYCCCCCFEFYFLCRYCCYFISVKGIQIHIVCPGTIINAIIMIVGTHRMSICRAEKKNGPFRFTSLSCLCVFFYIYVAIANDIDDMVWIHIMRE